MSQTEMSLFNSDFHYSSIYKTGSGKPDPKKIREVLRRAQEFARTHKVTILLKNCPGRIDEKVVPEDLAPHRIDDTIVLHRDQPTKFTILPNIEQVRFPRSKKKRIRKKWAMNPANWRKKPLMTFHVDKLREKGLLAGSHSPECRIQPLPHPYFTPSFMRRPSGDRGPVYFRAATVEGAPTVFKLPPSLAREVEKLSNHADFGESVNIRVTRREDGKGYEFREEKT